MHDRYANYGTRIAVVPQRDRKCRTRIKSKTWRIADEVLCASVEVIGSICVAKTVCCEHRAVVGEVIVERTCIVAIAIEGVITLQACNGHIAGDLSEKYL